MAEFPDADNLKAIQQRIDQAMIADRFRLRKMLNKCRENPDLMGELQRVLDASLQLVDQRRDSVPKLSYDDQLPITTRKGEILEVIRQHQVSIVCGETGSGKSTQLPKICLEAGFGAVGQIGHTQPRRIAARTIASRVSEELGTQPGSVVGHKIRFQDRTNPKTLIKLMTDGILLAETQSDRFLERYEVLIVDEAHERSLNIDFLLGFLKTLLPKRPDLKLIITSATIDAEKFSRHFAVGDSPAPVVNVSGRGFPVEMVYRPLQDPEKPERDMFDGILEAVQELYSVTPGDILVFLPTEKDIRTAAKKLRGFDYLKKFSPPVEILPLYARLTNAEQNQIFHPQANRRIVLATNVAESSLTVPRIKYVIDTGLARISRYSTRSKIQRLPIENISQASANQRAGRCGRLEPGVCIRLYSEEDFLTRDAYTTPEIRRTNLASVILQAKSMHFGDVDRIQFLEPPRPEAVREGYRTLYEIGATDGHGKLTKLGHRLKKFPCDPRIARMILAAEEEGVVADVLIIAAALEVQDVRDRPVEKKQAADQAHQQFVNEESDFITLLNIWDFFHQQKDDLSNNRLRKSLIRNFLSFSRIREWLDVYRQLREICSQNRIKVGNRKNLYENIHRSILAGMLSGIACRGEQFEYEGAGGVKAFLWPGSGLMKRAPRWILGSELVETSRNYIRNAARIKPEWIEPLAQHLVKKSHSDPFWHEKSEKVMANEKVTLFGLTIVPRRQVPYGKIDPAACRSIFIEEALINRRLPVRHDFQKLNQEFLEQADDLVSRTRDANRIVDSSMLWEFYEQRIPDHVLDGDSLRKWIQDKPEHDLKLRLAESGFLENDSSMEDQFPGQIATSTLDIPLDYSFEPGMERDGVTVRVPQAAIAQLNANRLDWLVPGMVPAKVEALIRSLPKSRRRGLAPIAETAKRVAGELTFADGNLIQAVSNELGKITGETISVDEFKPEKIDYHLKMNIEVVDESGKVVAAGRDLLELQKQFVSDSKSARPLEHQSEWNQSGLRKWDFGALPDSLTVEQGGMTIQAYPAIVDNLDSVSLKVFSTKELAELETRLGIMRLAAIAESKSIRKQVRWLPGLESWLVAARNFASPDELKTDLSDLMARMAFVDSEPDVPRNEKAFSDILCNSVQRISVAAQELATFLPKFFAGYQAAELAIEEMETPRYDELRKAILRQMDRLMPKRFWVIVPWNWLVRYPVYFQAISRRIEKRNPAKLTEELERESELESWWSENENIQKEHLARGVFDPDLIQFRFMLEEMRISIFCQQLRTIIPVSEKRLEKLLQKIRNR